VKPSPPPDPAPPAAGPLGPIPAGDRVQAIDILRGLALFGIIAANMLFFFRKRTDTTVLVWAIVAYLVPLGMMMGFAAAYAILGPALTLPTAPTPEMLQETVRIYRDGGWAAITAERASEATGHNWGYLVFFFPNLLGVFLFGMLAWRKRLFEPSDEAIAGYRKAMWAGLAIGVAGNAAAVIMRWVLDLNPMVPTPPTARMFVIQQIGVPALCVGYVSAVIVLVHDARWRARLSPFAAVGRTALSNYLFQSVAGTLLFYSYGLGLYGRGGPLVFLVPTVVIYALETVMSVWWLEWFRFGPVEWLWRSATYGRWQPLVREAASPGPS